MKAHAIAALCVLLSALAAPPVQADIPDNPQNVRKERLNDSEVLITWEGVSGEDGYEILRKDPLADDSEFELRGTVGANVTEFIDDAPRGPVFIYRVRAFNQDGDSDLSNECFVNRPRPPTPLQFNVRLIALTVVRVTWSDISAGEKGFEIQRARPGHGFKTVVKLPANTETYDDYDLVPATAYIYRVRALGKPAICWDHGKFTAERSVTTAGSVRTLQIEMRGSGGGKVRSIPEGINCGRNGGECTAEFPWNAIVTLTADPNDSSDFLGWEDISKCEDDNGPCSFNMFNDRVIGARFRRE